MHSAVTAEQLKGIDSLKARLKKQWSWTHLKARAQSKHSITFSTRTMSEDKIKHNGEALHCDVRGEKQTNKQHKHTNKHQTKHHHTKPHTCFSKSAKDTNSFPV